MKYPKRDGVFLDEMSPPSRGAWIEICRETGKACTPIVAPLAGGVD